MSLSCRSRRVSEAGTNSQNLVNWMPNRFSRARLRRSAASNDHESFASVRQTAAAGSASPVLMGDWAQEAGLDTLPNDLTQMLYLASLRDCNSGLYLHPQLSLRIGVEGADRALSACHEDVFGRLLVTTISGYAIQLEEYIRYTKTSKNTVLQTWQSLQAYRATVPLRACPLCLQLFFLNIEIALTILKDTRASVHTWPHEA